MKLFPKDQMPRGAEKGIRKQKPGPTQLVLLPHGMASCQPDEDTASELKKIGDHVDMKKNREVQEN